MDLAKTESSMVNIASYLPAMAARQPDALAVVVQGGRGSNGEFVYRKYSARELDEDSDRIAHGLAQTGIGRGVRTVLMVKPSIEFFSLT